MDKAWRKIWDWVLGQEHQCNYTVYCSNFSLVLLRGVNLFRNFPHIKILKVAQELIGPHTKIKSFWELGYKIVVLMARDHCCIDLKHLVCTSAGSNVGKVCIRYLVWLLFYQHDAISWQWQCPLVSDGRCNIGSFLVSTIVEPGGSAGLLHLTGLCFAWKGCRLSEHEILFSKNQRTTFNI